MNNIYVIWEGPIIRGKDKCIYARSEEEKRG